MPSSTDPWGGPAVEKNKLFPGGATHSFLANQNLEQAIPAVSNGLRGAMNGTRISTFQEGHDPKVLSDEETVRRLQPSTTVQVVNNCEYDTKAYAIYFSNGQTKYVSWTVLHKNEILTLPGMTDPVFYIFGMTMDHRWEWAADDTRFCFHENQCFRKVELGALPGGTVQYKTCGPPPPEPGTFADEWLQAHNSRRTKFYQENGLGPMDLKWAPSLATSAQNYANKLIKVDNGCYITHCHENDCYAGENLGANWGSGQHAKPRSAETVLTSWYDREMLFTSLAAKYHATQVAFRSSRYLGCAEASKTLPDGYMCFIHVCRYIAQGNCFGPGDWKDSVLSDDIASRCNGDQCLSLDESCF